LIIAPVIEAMSFPRGSGGANEDGKRPRTEVWKYLTIFVTTTTILNVSLYFLTASISYLRRILSSD
jgi:hypothetical protein